MKAEFHVDDNRNIWFTFCSDIHFRYRLGRDGKMKTALNSVDPTVPLHTVLNHVLHLWTARLQQTPPHPTSQSSSMPLRMGKKSLARRHQPFLQRTATRAWALISRSCQASRRWPGSRYIPASLPPECRGARHCAGPGSPVYVLIAACHSGARYKRLVGSDVTGWGPRGPEVPPRSNGTCVHRHRRPPLPAGNER